MDAHFGPEEAERRDLHLDFEIMKREYQNYEKWHPSSRIRSDYQRGLEDHAIKSIIDNLKMKNRQASNKFNFQ